jgi:hypothetical protein
LHKKNPQGGFKAFGNNGMITPEKPKEVVIMTYSNVKRMVFTAVCAALCLVLPMAFHSIPNAGSVMLPKGFTPQRVRVTLGSGAGGATQVFDWKQAGAPAAPSAKEGE